jgi:phage-related protein
MSTSERWGIIEFEPEVDDWLMRTLREEEREQAVFHINLLAQQGVLLRAPYTRHLGGKLWELRFYIDRTRQQIPYYIATGRRIILLTVFHKTKQREKAEIERARKVMQRCIDEGHTPDDHLEFQEARDDGD